MHGQRAKQNFFFHFRCWSLVVYRAKNPARKRRNSSEKWKRNHFDWNCVGRMRRECIQSGANVVETALLVTECDLFSEPLAASRTCDPSCFFLWRQRHDEFHALLKRRVFQRNQSAQPFVCLARHFHSRNYFLSNIATLFVIDRASLKIGFDRNNLLGEFPPPARQSLFDSHHLRDIRIGEDRYRGQLSAHSIALRWFGPYVPTGSRKTARGNNPVVLERWRLVCHNVKERELIGDVLNLNVVGE